MPEIVLRGLTKAYNGVTVLRGVSLEIADGELITLVGPSGCGKTTTLKILAGLIAPDQGEILIDGREITSVPVEKRDIVMVFQENLLFPHMTVGENITFGLKMAGCSRRYREAKLREMLELVQLPDLKNRYPAQLSGGQQQRVALARALALEPRILLLDEPLSNLDPRLRDEMRELIREIHKKMKMNIVLVTHDQLEAMLMADRIAVMFDGKIIQCDTPYNIYNRPATREVASLFGPCNTLSGFIQNGRFKTGGREFAVPGVDLTGEVVAFIRAEAIELVDSEPDLRGVVVENRYTGGHSLLRVDTGDGEFLVRVDRHADLVVNSRVGLKIRWDKACFNKGDAAGGEEHYRLRREKREVKGFVGRTVAVGH
ncbi:MAG: ABC transporter ATP-binding protein [Firmicutes bacterium]|nr:ABC transporter ATP-binding protein [Bacillota bacterium]